MRYLIWFLLLFAGFNLQAQNNTVYGAGISYTNGAPTWFPNPRTSRAAVDTVTGRWYHFNTPGGWQWIGNTVEEIGGCAAPAYTPNKGDSRIVVNNCTRPQVYWYDGATWKWINEGEVYTAGQGIRIESNSIILDSLYILRFRTGSNTDGAAGTMSWNATEETVDLVTDQGAVTGHLMESAYYNTRNTTGAPIPISHVVMANGTTGNTGRILIAPAIADGTVNSEYILGITAQAIGNNSNGKVQHFGKIRGIQTNGSNFGETWLDGDVLYCSAATPGYLTNVQPTAPNLKVPIAIVIHAHPNNGTLFVRPSHFPDLAQINDVQLSSPANGQVLTYNSTLSRWENAAPADPSSTNELQTLSVATNTATLSNSGGSVTIAGAGINTVGTAGTTITVTGTEVDGSTTNELQTLSTGTNTLTLSNGGGTVTVDTDPANDVTGSGASGQVSFWTGAQTQSGDNGLFWNNTDKRLGVGTSSPTVTAQIVGSGSTSATNSFLVQNNNSNNLFRVRNDGAIIIGTRTNEEPFIAPFSATTQFGAAQRTLGFVYSTGGGTRPNPAFYFNASSNLTHTTADGDFVLLGYTFNPTSGSGTMNALNIQPTINQTGGANGNTRGLFIAPTITNAANWRSIEYINTSGWGIYGSGSAPSYFAGNTTIGSTSTPARLHVVGSGTSSSTWTAQFHNSAGNNNALMIRDDGNVGIGTNAPSAKLQINGSGNTNTTTSLAIQNSDGVSLLRVRDDLYTSINYLRVGNSFNTSALVFPFVTNSGVPDAAGTNLSFYNYTGANSAVNGAFAFAGSNFTQTSGNHVFFRFSHNFFPTSGNASYSASTFRPSINQTGGANGITRGLYMDPSITAAADWRSIEWSNSSGWGIYGAGTAKSYFAGNVAIGTDTPNASSAFEVASTTQGILFPRMTTTQRNAIATPADGLVIYNTTDNKLQVRAGGAWVDLH